MSAHRERHRRQQTKDGMKPQNEDRNGSGNQYIGRLGCLLGIVIAVMFTTARPSYGQLAVKHYFDMEDSRGTPSSSGDTITGPWDPTGILGAAAHFDTTNPGSWDAVPWNSVLKTFTASQAGFSEPQIAGSVSVGGNTYTDSGGSRVFGVQLTSAKNQYINYWFSSSPPAWGDAPTYSWRYAPSVYKSKVSLGCYIHLASTNGYGADGDWYDLIVMQGEYHDWYDNDEGGTEYFTLNFLDGASGAKIRAHTELTGTGTDISVSRDQTYWVTMLWDNAGGACYLEVYETTGWTRVGYTTSTAIIGNLNCGQISFGRYDNHAGTPGSWVFFDDIMIDDTGNTWPLIPKPVVWVEVLDASASENSGGWPTDKGKFRIKRTGSTSSSLAVSVGFGDGTAIGPSPSFDFSIVVGSSWPTTSITIPAGNSYVDVEVLPWWDGYTESAETVVLKINSGSAYAIWQNSGTVTINAN